MLKLLWLALIFLFPVLLKFFAQCLGYFLKRIKGDNRLRDILVRTGIILLIIGNLLQLLAA